MSHEFYKHTQSVFGFFFDLPTCPAVLKPDGISSCNSSGRIDFIMSTVPQVSRPATIDSIEPGDIIHTVSPVSVVKVCFVGDNF